MTTSRTDFNETWLTEAPEGLGDFETYDGLVYSIKDMKNANADITKLPNGLNKIELSSTIYYWYEDNGVITLGVILDKRPQGLVVSLTGKNPKYRGRPPYASDLYSTILDDNKGKSIRLFSDVTLSDEGKALWDRLFNNGKNVSVYDRQNPGKSFTTFKSQEEMDSYFQHDNTDFRRYNYVLSEGISLLETRSFFNIRRYRELVPGMGLED